MNTKLHHVGGGCSSEKEIVNLGVGSRTPVIALLLL